MNLQHHREETALTSIGSSCCPTLRAVAELVLASPCPMILWHGKELLGQHNQAAEQLLGRTSLATGAGRPAREAWRSHWELLEPAFQAGERGRAARTQTMQWSAVDGQTRYERHIAIACTPVRAETGKVVGILGTLEDLTEQVIAARRSQLLSRLHEASRSPEPWKAIEVALASAAYDIPLLLVYELDPAAETARLRVASGMRAGDRRAPRSIRLNSDTTWPLQSVVASRRLQHLRTDRLGFQLANGPWPEGIGEVLLAPLCTREHCDAVAIVGLSPRLPIDDGYRRFLDQVARACEPALVETCDLTSLHEARRRQQALQQQAETASRAKDEFLALLGHELRNPLAPIVTALDLMRMRDGADDRERAVIERQVGHLRRLVDDLLDVARITRGKLKLDVHRVRVEDVVDRAVEMAGPLLEERRHPLHVAVPRHLQVRGDVIRLAQIVANLLTNAAKYSEEGKPIIVEAAEQADEVVLSVTDQGVGIPGQMLPHLFDPFVQVGRQERQSAGGLGLGLALVRSLTELHGGRVVATSEGPGLGSCFMVHLPAVHGWSSSRTDLPSLEDDESCDDEQLERRVLVVDDNEDAAEMLAVVLRREGYRVEVANDGPSALDKATWFNPQIGILDIGLPVMDGYVLAQKLREQRHSDARPGDELVLIALTGYGRPRDRMHALATGFNEHFVKPVDFAALRECLAQRLSQSSER